MLGFGFIFISGFALLPALIVVLITEAFYIRSVLAYALGGALVGAACYLGLIPFDPETMQLRRHRAPSSRNHDRRGHRRRPVYWMIAGRNAGAWREPPRRAAAASAAAVAFDGRRRRDRETFRSLFIRHRLG